MRENVLLTIDDDMKAKFLVDITKKIIVNGYDTLPEKDRSFFKTEIIKTIEELK